MFKLYRSMLNNLYYENEKLQFQTFFLDIKKNFNLCSDMAKINEKKIISDFY